jgi:hypothetical protein
MAAGTPQPPAPEAAPRLAIGGGIVVAKARRA